MSVTLEEPRYEFVGKCNARLIEDVTVADEHGRGIVKPAHHWVCSREPHRRGRHKATWLGDVVRRWRS